MRVYSLWCAFIAFILAIQPTSLLSQSEDSGFYVFIKKPSSWGDVYLYTWDDSVEPIREPLGSWPGQKLRSDSLWFQYYLTADALDPKGGLNLIFHDGVSKQSPDLYRSKVGWYVLADSGLSGEWFDTRPDDPTYELVVYNGSGSGQYRGGSLVNVQAEEPDEWSLFTEWSGPGSDLLNDRYAKATQLSMPQSDISVSAEFESYQSGATFYKQQCGFCHGAEGAGGVGPSLLDSDGACESCKDFDQLVSRIAVSMPQGNPKACDGDSPGDCAYETSRFIRKFLNRNSSNSCDIQAENVQPRRIRLLTKEEYWSSVQDLLGFRADFPEKFFWPEPALVKGYDNNSNASVVTDRHIQVFTQLSDYLAENYKPDLGSLACGSDVDCQVKKFGMRVFRRPLNSDEVSRFTATLKEQGLEAMVESLLLSPNFLYRFELGSWDEKKQLYRLSDYEIASFISYSTVGSMPDMQLLEAAQKGLLVRADERRKQMARLLSDPRAEDYVEKFAGLWLEVENLADATREDPDLTPQIREQMIEETKSFISRQMLDKNADFSDLFLADYTYTRPELARYYGLSDQASTGLAPRKLTPERVGILGHGSILASQSSSAESSPIKRGVFVRGRLLCQELPPPPANVDTTIPPPIAGQTIRERLKRHQSQGEQPDGANSCFSCHRFIDSLGFGFEGFDFAAKHRTIYEEIGGVEVDTSGSILNLEGLNEPSEYAFNSLSELGEILAGSSSAKSCAVTQLYRYTYGTKDSRNDQCAIKELEKVFRDSDYSMRSLLEGLASSEYFIYRYSAL